MDLKSTIRLGGVPEHFNYPWKIWLEKNNGQFQGFTWTWTDFPGGSGAMIQSLEADETDVAFVLTEAVANALLKGSQIQPLSVFVESPLVWGIFSSAKNPVSQVSPVAGKKYAISRYGSGSELMAKVDANTRGSKIEQANFVLVQNLEGARKAIGNLEADLFFWEKWMTKPLVDAGEFKMIDECPTPWPCFLMVCTSAFKTNLKRLNALKTAYSEVLSLANDLKSIPGSAEKLAMEYGLKSEDSKTWLSHVQWAKAWQSPENEIAMAKKLLEEIY